MPRKLGRCCAHQIAGACSCRSPSFIRERGGLKTCQNSSRFNSNVDDENTLHLHHGSLRRTDMFYQRRVRGFLLGRFIFSACKLLLLGTRDDPDREDTSDTVILNQCRVNEDRLCLCFMKRACWDDLCAFYARRANQTGHIWGSLSTRGLASTLIESNYKLYL